MYFFLSKQCLLSIKHGYLQSYFPWLYNTSQSSIHFKITGVAAFALE